MFNVCRDAYLIQGCVVCIHIHLSGCMHTRRVHISIHTHGDTQIRGASRQTPEP